MSAPHQCHGNFRFHDLKEPPAPPHSSSSPLARFLFYSFSQGCRNIGRCWERDWEKMTTLLTLRMSRTLSFSKQGSNEPCSRRVVQRLGKITKQITKKTDYLSDRDDKKVCMPKLKTGKSRNDCMFSGGGVGVWGVVTKGTNWCGPETKYTRSKIFFTVTSISFSLECLGTQLLGPYRAVSNRNSWYPGRGFFRFF